MKSLLLSFFLICANSSFSQNLNAEIDSLLNKKALLNKIVKPYLDSISDIEHSILLLEVEVEKKRIEDIAENGVEVKTIGTKVDLYDSVNFGQKSIFKLPASATLIAIGVERDYVHVKYKNHVGYINQTWLTQSTVSNITGLRRNVSSSTLTAKNTSSSSSKTTSYENSKTKKKSNGTWVKGHYRTSKNGKRHWVNGHYRKN